MGAGLQPGGGLGSRRARRRSAAPMSEINVTPMVDVMLVLLIIFMVTAPMLTAGIEVVPQPDLPKVNLPKTEAGPMGNEYMKSERPFPSSSMATGGVQYALPD